MKILIMTSDPHYRFVRDIVRTRNVVDNLSRIVSYTPYYNFSDNYDIGVSFMYQYKIPKEQLSKTWINFHPGPLPEYKGRNLCYHALMNGEEQFGASVHYMDEGFDTGDIIDVWTFPILKNDTAGSLSEMTMQTSYRLFEEYLPRIVAGEQFKKIPNVGGNYYKKEPIEEFLLLSDDERDEIRAITYGDFYPKIDIGGDIYKVVPE